MVADMASITSPARTITIVECAECDVDKDVHVIDGCSAPTWQRVKVCSGCFERPDLCAC
jgi:hypothetical protein